MVAYLSLILVAATCQWGSSALAYAASSVSRGASASCTLSASGGDDSPQLLAAVQSCPVTVISSGTTLNIGTRLNMTGVTDKHISIAGTMRFNPDIPYWTGNAFSFPFQDQVTFWILGGQNILLDGGGTLDGAGQAWYDEFADNSTLLRPIILTVYEGTNVTVENVQMVNGPGWSNFVNAAQDVTYDNITINAASTSDNVAKNTDGWDIYRSDNVVLKNSVINNGDDCVSFKPNSTNILVSNLQCTGSHGISVGSLGQYSGEYDLVQNVLATGITMTNAQNGARIKAFAGKGVGSGLVKNVTFADFFESNVDNPLIIDQCYMTSATSCSEYPSNVYIQDIFFTNISGTSSGSEKSVVANLGCSPDQRCSNINVNDISLAPPSKYGNATYECQNVNVTGDAASDFGDCTVTG
ncbi:glycoside hydrolase family 28 protein [Plicaturopsis crispa FD-325 SS-3]|nr:glycoside hydrolase family 28 protein [Plicaturopsis crispa FD-325 SS-3]